MNRAGVHELPELGLLATIMIPFAFTGQTVVNPMFRVFRSLIVGTFDFHFSLFIFEVTRTLLTISIEIVIVMTITLMVYYFMHFT